MPFQLSPDAALSLETSLAYFGRHAAGWRTHAGALTKQEVFGKLALEGVRRGYIPLGEYEIRYTNALGEGAPKEKAIDLVWARRAPSRAFSREAANQTIWDIVAAFEIEGYDNGATREPGAHLRQDVAALAEARRRWGAQATALALFSVAYDRESKGAPHPAYQDTKNAPAWCSRLREQIAALDTTLRGHPDYAAHTATPVLLDHQLDAWLATLRIV